MAEFVSSVEVDAAPETVFAAATDWDRHGRWMLFTHVRRLARDGVGEGGQIEAVTGVGPVALRDPMTVRVWRPPYRIEMHHDGPVLRGVGAFDVEPLPDGRSRFTWSEWLDPPLGLVGELGLALTRPLVGLFFAVCLRRLARWVPAR